MAEQTNIEWADSTLNVWMGCQETGSPACVGCYARQLVEGRFGLTTWGPHGKRVETKSWRANLSKISRLAAAEFSVARTEPWFVFVNSLSDFWDNRASPTLRAEALVEFAKHPHLTFLLLTKRPQNILKMARAMCEAEIGPYVDSPGDLAGWWPRNVAIGCTVVTQAEAGRDIPHLLRAAAALRPAFTFVSMEPLVEIVDLTNISAPGWSRSQGWDALRGAGNPSLEGMHAMPRGQRVDWCITGGGTDQGKHKAYPTPIDAFRKVRDDCAAAGVAYLHKQNGEFEEARFVMGPAPTQGKKVDLAIMTTQRIGGLYMDTGSVRRVGKKAAGRLLDGRTHDERPKVAV